MLVHAAAAVAVAGILGSLPRTVSHRQDPLHVDIAYAAGGTFEIPSPQPAVSAAGSPGAQPAAQPVVTARPAARTPRVRRISAQQPAAASALAPEPDLAARPWFALSGGTVATRAAVAVVRTASIDGGNGGGLERALVATSGSSARAGAAAPTAPAAPAAVAVLLEREVDVRARLVAATPLVYPAAARRAEIEVDYPVEIVVDATGRVTAARPVSRAGYGIDEAALGAVGQYQFSPARRDGRAVAVRMRWAVQFRLR